MQIRTRLTLQFLAIGAAVLIMASIAIYFFSSGHRKEDFYSRLENKATNTAMLLIQFDEVDLELLKRIEADNPISLPRERITIYDFRNQIIYSTDEGQVITVDEEFLDEIRLKGKVRLKQGDYEVLGFLFTEEFDRFVIIAAGVDVFGWRKIKNLRNILLGVISSSLLVLLFSGWLYAGKALKPISRIVTQVDDITIANLATRLDQGNNKDEIARLAATFNNLLERLETAFASQKQFISNASHELRTPLTVITGQLEVVLLKKRKTADYERVIASVLDDMRKLNRTSNRLLILAQASAAQLADLNISPLRVDEIIWNTREQLIKRDGNYQIHFNMAPSIDEESKMIIQGDELLIRAMIINLMENGCKYSYDKKVMVNLAADINNLILTFTDHGIGIHQEDLDSIFEPFRRGKNAAHIKGHGIGLSLVEKIINLHNGHIKVESAPDKGSVFTVVLPRQFS
jgi:signal transduction histidine kinase